MQGFILNTDPLWFENIKTNGIFNPVFWSRGDRNPSGRFIQEGNLVFLRITRQKPPTINGYGIISELGTSRITNAYAEFGIRLGYQSVGEMIEVSNKWTSSVNLTVESNIFHFSIENLVLITPYALENLEKLGISFNHRYIVIGKGYNPEETSLLLSDLKANDSLETFINENKNYLNNRTRKQQLEVIVRYQNIVDKQKLKYNNCCQIAGCGFRFKQRNGNYYSEAHHIIPLSKGGSQDANNVLILCANHHRMIHYATIEYLPMGEHPKCVVINNREYEINWN